MREASERMVAADRGPSPRARHSFGLVLFLDLELVLFMGPWLRHPLLMDDSATRTVFRSCTLCEATCGLRFEVEGDRILSARGGPGGVFPRGSVCAKGIAIAAAPRAPDRPRSPVRRTAA